MAMQVQESLSMSKRLLYLLLCAGVFMVPRLWGLGQNWTDDEELWVGRSYNFINSIESGRYKETLQSIHPGVVTMWSIGLTQKLMGYETVHGNGKPTPSPYDINEEKLAIMKGGLVVVCLLFFIFIFYFLIKLIGTEAAVIASLFIALDPLLAGHTRTLHLDGIFVFSGFASMLASLIYFSSEKRSLNWAIFSGIFAGLAILNRIQGFFFLALFVFFGMVSFLWPSIRSSDSRAAILKKDSVATVTALLSSLFVVFLLFPALWDSPSEVLRHIITGALELALKAHENPNYIFGSINEGSPGYFVKNLFYWAVLFFRLPPPVELLIFIGLLYGIFSLFRMHGRQSTQARLVLLSVMTVAFFIASISVGKKFSTEGRYILFTFPVVSMLAAVSLVSLGKKAYKKTNYTIGRFLIIIIIAFFPLFSLSEAVRAMPYPLAYVSPLAGGPDGYQKLSCIGWGEGYYEVKRWLEEHGRADDTVLTNYTGLEPFHKGRLLSLHRTKNLDVDIVVLYNCPVLRNFPSATGKIKKELEEKGYPKHTIKILGSNYFFIYELKQAGEKRTNLSPENILK
jgi:hypothetical protein